MIFILYNWDKTWLQGPLLSWRLTPYSVGNQSVSPDSDVTGYKFGVDTFSNRPRPTPGGSPLIAVNTTDEWMFIRGHGPEARNWTLQYTFQMGGGN